MRNSLLDTTPKSTDLRSTAITLAEETDTSVDLAEEIFKQELAALQSVATVHNFVSLIAVRRTKALLRSLS